MNGAGGFDPDAYDRLRHTMFAFPDAASVARLRELGVRTVLLHLDRAAGSSWESLRDRPVGGLPVEREVIGTVVLFRIEPSASAAARER